MLPTKYKIPRKYFLILTLIACVQIYYTINYFFSSNSIPFIRRSRNRLKPNSINWIGNAYIISTKLYIPDEVTDAAKACGFLPQKLPPKLPFGEHYEYNKKQFYESCFGVPGRILLPYDSSWC
jgi:hypothetical protein